MTNTRYRIGTVFSPDDGHILAPKHVEKSNKYIKKICAPTWFYLQDYTSMHGQQNIKFHGSVVRHRCGGCTVTGISVITPHLSAVLKLVYISKVVICIVTCHDSYSNGLVGLGLLIAEVS